MATVSQTPLTALAEKLITVTGLSTTVHHNITSATTGTLYLIEVDNTVNTKDAIYLKIADANSAVPGTTQPKLQFRIPSNTKQTIAIPNGHVYAAGLCVWITTSASASTKVAADSAITAKFLVTT